MEEIATDILHQLPETVEELAEGDVRASTSSIFTLRLKHILTKELPDLRDKEKNRCELAIKMSITTMSSLFSEIREKNR